LVQLGALLVNQPDPDLVTATVDLVFNHPSYSSFYLINDIGLLRLSQPLAFTDTIRPICLPTPNINFNKFKVCVTTGFGQVYDYGW
jgi:Trypsin